MSRILNMGLAFGLLVAAVSGQIIRINGIDGGGAISETGGGARAGGNPGVWFAERQRRA